MLQVFDVHPEKRDEIPAVTHVDGTSRIQTIDRADNPVYYDLIDTFRERTGVPVVLNTSLNRRGEPIVCTPEDAIDCFVGTEMDAMCLPDAGLLVADPVETGDRGASADPVSSREREPAAPDSRNHPLRGDPE